MKKCYILSFDTGSFEDRSYSSEKIFLNKEKAEKECKKLNEMFIREIQRQMIEHKKKHYGSLTDFYFETVEIDGYVFSCVDNCGEYSVEECDLDETN